MTEVSRHFGTGAEVSYGHFGTGAEVSWVRSVCTPAVRQRVRFKLEATAFKVKHFGLLAYLHEDLHDYQPTRMLQSSTAHLLQ